MSTNKFDVIVAFNTYERTFTFYSMDSVAFFLEELKKAGVEAKLERII